MPTTAYRAIIDASDGSGGRLCGCGGNGWRDGIAKACSPSQFRTCRFPASGSSRESLAHSRDITMDNPSRWERMPLQESIEAFPWGEGGDILTYSARERRQDPQANPELRGDGRGRARQPPVG